MSEIRDAGGSATSDEADVSDPHTVSAIGEAATEEFGALNVVVNNAEIYPRTTWESFTWDRCVESLAVNLGGVFKLTRFALPNLLENDGTIVNVSSIWGLRGGSADVCCTASKGGLVTPTKQLCQE